MDVFDISEGAYIEITFTQPLTSGGAGDEGCFTVSWQEYDKVPGGTLISKSVTPAGAWQATNADKLILQMPALQRFLNAVGNITVEYDGSGFLGGVGGSVEAFSVSFSPVSLVSKPNQNHTEHIELLVTPSGTLTRIYHSNVAGPGRISLGVTATGTLTHVDDL